MLNIRSLVVLALTILNVAAQIYPPGYPKNCTNIGPAGYTPTKTYNFGPNLVCTIPDFRPPGGYVPPAIGVTWTDPNLGHTARISTPIGHISSYSTPSALSRTGKYLFAMGLEVTQGGDSIAGTSDIYNATTGALVRKTVGASGDWGIWWGADDDTYYTVVGPNIEQRSVADATKKVRVLTTARGFRSGGTGDLAPDLWMAYATSLDRATGFVCAAKLDGLNKEYCIEQSKLSGPAFDFALMSRGRDSGTGKRYVMVERGGSILSVNEQTGVLDIEVQSAYTTESYAVSPKIMWNHSDTVQAPDGRQYIFSVMEYEPNVSLPDLNGNKYGGRTLCLWPLSETDPMKINRFIGSGGSAIPIMRVGWNSPVVSGAMIGHYNCARNAPVCTVGSGVGPIADTGDASGLAPYKSEAVAINVLSGPSGPTFEIHRLGAIRGVMFSKFVNDYYTLPMCGLSGDASRVTCRTNFGSPDPDGQWHPVGQSLGGHRQMVSFDTGLTGATLPPLPVIPAIIRFDAVPTSIIAGASATLTWQTTDAASVAISGIGAVTLSGSLDVQPPASIDYALTATGPGGSATRTVSIAVAPAPVDPLVELEKRVAALELQASAGAAKIAAIEAELLAFRIALPSAEARIAALEAVLAKLKAALP